MSTGNDFRSYIKACEANSVLPSEERSEVSPFWFRVSGKAHVPESVQAAHLALYKEKQLTAKGEGKSTRFYLSSAESAMKPFMVVNGALVEVGALLLVVSLITTVAGVKSGLFDGIGLAVSVFFMYVYFLRSSKLLMFGYLIASVPFTTPAKLLISLPVIKGANLIGFVVSASFGVMFTRRMLHEASYPLDGPHWFTASQGVLHVLQQAGLFFAVAFVASAVIGAFLAGSWLHASNTLQKHGLLAFYGSGAVEDLKPVDTIVNRKEVRGIKVVGHGFMFSLALSLCAAYVLVSGHWG